MLHLGFFPISGDEFWLKNSPILTSVIGGGLLVYLIRRWVEKSDLLLNRQYKESEINKIAEEIVTSQ